MQPNLMEFLEPEAASLFLLKACAPRRSDATWACFREASNAFFSNHPLVCSPMIERRIVFNQRFEWIAAAIMVGNSLLVGIEAEFTLNNLNAAPQRQQGVRNNLQDLARPTCFQSLSTEEQYWLIRIFDVIFNVCFTVELGLRLAAWSLVGLVFRLSRLKSIDRCPNGASPRRIRNSLSRATILLCTLALENIWNSYE